jgi:HK97 family phage portal protein
MGIFDKLFKLPEERSSLENPSVDLWKALAGASVVQLGAGNTIVDQAGISVTPENSLGFATVFACVRLISEQIASLPFHLFEKVGPSRRQVDDDPRAWLLNESPNPEMDSMMFWESALSHLLLWGNAYLFKQINPITGLTEALWLLAPQHTRPERLSDNSIIYVTQLENGETRYLTIDEVIHVRAFGTSLVGISPIGAAKRAIGIGVAADEYAGRFYVNDGRPGGIIRTDKPMTEEQYLNFKARWQAGHQGLSNSHLIGILDNGLQWQDVGIPMADAQFIEQRKWQALEVARVYRVQPNKIGILDQGTVSYASVEQANLSHVTDCLLPWAVRLEKAIHRGMFGSEPDRKRKLYPKIQLNGLLRGDMAARASYYEKGIGSGWLLRSEVRELEDLPFIEGIDNQQPTNSSENGN